MGLTTRVLAAQTETLSAISVSQVYHISRNLWSRLETRTVKNVCAPAAVIEDKIYIIGGEQAAAFNMFIWFTWSIM